MPTPERVAFTIFGMDIMWYGIIITCGIAIAMYLAVQRAPKHEISKDRIIDFLLICIPVGVIGARVYYVLFNWQNYAGDFGKMINFRLGGLAIHGGLIFGLLTAFILCKVWKVRPLNLMDLIVPSIAIAQSIGRWGNYFNQEAHGGPTDLPWGIMIDGVKVHPTFLYESIWCFLLFLLLIFVDNRRRFEGEPFLLYCILYSVERFFVEGLRTDSLMLFGTFRQAQVLSACVIVIGIIAYVYLMQRKKIKENKI